MTGKASEAAEERFREALVEYLRAEGALDDNNLLTNWHVLGTTAVIDDPNCSGVVSVPSTGFPFWAQVGLLKYALTRHEGRINEDEPE
jgi:hypothetical protein